MRRLAFVVIALGLALSSQASADPFANLAQSLEHYDQRMQEKPAPKKARSRSPRGRDSAVVQAENQMLDTRPMARQAQASIPQDMPEEVQPVPMSEEPFEQSMDGYYPGDVWEEPVGGCSDGSCGMGCGWSQPGFWGRAEYLAWWVRGAYVPALVTTSPTGTPVGTAGRLPGATILFGDQRINENARSGGRFTLGYWFDPCNQLGIENTFFFIGGQNQGYTNSSSGSPILARPFYNTDSEEQDSVLLAYPSIAAGGINTPADRS